MATPENNAGGGFGATISPAHDTSADVQLAPATTDLHCSSVPSSAPLAGNRGPQIDGHDHFAGMDGIDDQEHGPSAGANMHALRIEGRKWVNDITLPQAWAILQATAQELDSGRDLLFMMLMPNGRQPALCLNQSLFAQQLPTPAALAARLAARQEH